MLQNPLEAGAGYSSLAALFVAQAKRYPKKILYRFWHAGLWQSLTWSEALIRVQELALGLISLGVAKDDRVVIFSGNRVEWLLIDWANICIGALSVPIYASSSASQALHIINHADPAVLIVDSARRLDKLDFTRAALSGLKATVHFTDEKAERVIYGSSKTLSFEALRAAGRLYDIGQPGAFEARVQSLQLQDDLTIIYTSGTTGVPKGVLTTHANYLFMIRAVDAAVPSSERDVTLHFLPTAHSLGRLEHFMAVAKGWTLGVARSIETIPTDLREIRPTVLFSVPRIYENAYSRIRLRLKSMSAWKRQVYEWALAAGKRRVEHHQRGVKLDARRALMSKLINRLIFAPVRAGFGSRLRVAISGGAPLASDVALFFRAMDVAILEGYGLTETSTVSHVNRPDHFKLGAVGLPLAGTECRIADDGEILLRGPHIFKAYFRDLLATEEAIDGAGWFHTGDIGVIDADGFLTVTDRKK
ncbi:MAG TPA: AMP-binding protein, partial [Terriglobales bacterium]|nr:AMP-binding protein [Terriglobales bacterium]